MDHVFFVSIKKHREYSLSARSKESDSQNYYESSVVTDDGIKSR